MAPMRFPKIVPLCTLTEIFACCSEGAVCTRANTLSIQSIHLAYTPRSLITTCSIQETQSIWLLSAGPVRRGLGKECMSYHLRWLSATGVWD